MTDIEQCVRDEKVVEAAQAVVDAAPGYTAKGGSIWPLDHALDRLRAALAAAKEVHLGE